MLFEAIYPSCLERPLHLLLSLPYWVILLDLSYDCGYVHVERSYVVEFIEINVVLMSFQVINVKSTMLEFYAYEEIKVW